MLVDQVDVEVKRNTALVGVCFFERVLIYTYIFIHKVFYLTDKMLLFITQYKYLT